MFKNLFVFLRSLRLTIFLIICLAVIFLLGVLIPQKSLLGRDLYIQWKQGSPMLVSFLEALKFTDIYISPVTMVLWGLFFLNLLFIMMNRIPAIWSRCFRVVLPATVDSVKAGRYFEIVDNVENEKIRIVLQKRKYEIFDNDIAFWAVRNRFSPLATILFHLSFFLLLTGSVISFYTMFKGEADIAMGETFVGQYNWVKTPKLGEMPWAKFTVSDVIPVYYKKNVPVKLDVEIKTDEGTEIIGINRPYKKGPLSFVIKGIDIAPLFVVRDINGREIDGAYVKLKGLQGKEDYFAMAGYRFKTLFHSDYALTESGTVKETANLPQALQQAPMSRETTRQKEVINPAFEITILKDGKPVKNGILKKGGSIEFDDRRLIFSDLTYWVKFYVVKEYGTGIVYAGFTVMVLALFMRFIFYRREIKGFFEEGRLYVGGRGEFYQALFEEEFKEIIKNLKA